MKAFEYATPATVAEAVSLLSEKWGETEVLAGGTDLVTSLKQGITAPKRVVSLKGVGLKGISAGGDKLVIGAMTTMGDLAANKTVRDHFPALAVAAAGVASPQLLAVGTVGGDLCQRPRCWYFRNGFGLLAQRNGKSLVAEGDNRNHAIFGNEGAAKFVSASSLGPALVALGATMQTNSREIPARDFFSTPTAETGQRELALKPNEILTEIRVPMVGLRNATYEVRHRWGLDWPYVTASVAFKREGDNASNCVIVLGHVAPTPWVAKAAGSALDGKSVSAQSASACGEAAATGAHPLSRNGYKVQMVKTAVKRAVLAAAGMQAR
jgi:xanthine dehydrogenase YagS FAD-binding subunit